MSERTSLLLIIVLALVAAAGGAFASRWFMAGGLASAPEGLAVVEVGDRRPDLQFSTLDGQPQPLAAFDGRPLLVNYWATWCPPCIEELPRLAALHARRDGDGIAVLAIAMEHDADAVRAFVEQHGVDLPVLIEAPGPRDSSVRFGNLRNVLPYSVLIGADGRVLDTAIGELDEGELADWAERVTR